MSKSLSATKKKAVSPEMGRGKIILDCIAKKLSFCFKIPGDVMVIWPKHTRGKCITFRFK